MVYGRKGPKANLLQLLSNCLRHGSKGRWLFMLHNADDAGFLLDSPEMAGEAQLRQRRIDYIPTCDHDQS